MESTSTKTAAREVTQKRLHQLIRQRGPVREGTFEIIFLAPGVEAYATVRVEAMDEFVVADVVGTEAEAEVSPACCAARASGAPPGTPTWEPERRTG